MNIAVNSKINRAFIIRKKWTFSSRIKGMVISSQRTSIIVSTFIAVSYCLCPCRSGEDPVPLQCVAKHPGQHHIVATGGEDGMLCIWDLRQENYPINPLQAHSATCEYSGELIQRCEHV